LEIVKYLIDNGAEVNTIDTFGNSPLWESIKNNHEEVSKLLFENGAVLNLSNEKVSDILCEISSKGDYQTLRLYILYGKININIFNYDKRTVFLFYNHF
jgi:potassium channel